MESFRSHIENNYVDFVNTFLEICQSKKLDPRKIGSCESSSGPYGQVQPIFKLKINEGKGKSVCLMAGIHGNEEGGPFGLLEFLKGNIPNNVSLTVFPMINPYGFTKSIRRNEFNKDINRGFCDISSDISKLLVKHIDEKFDLLCTLHEDPSSKELYLYYSDSSKINTYKKILDMGKKYFPVNDKNSIHKNKAEDGLIFHGNLDKTPKNKCSIETYLFDRGVHYFTTEPPTKNVDLNKRIQFFKQLIPIILADY
jgi:hypothetical protein